MKEGLALDHIPVNIQWRDRSGISPASSFHLRVHFEPSGPGRQCQGGGRSAHGSLALGRLFVATRLTLISHAATEAQRLPAFPSDEPLEEREIAKISALGWIAPRAQRLLSAPERRARETAQAAGLSAEVAKELRDCDYGAWSGLTLSEVEQRQPEEVCAWLTDPGAAPHGGESIMQLIARIGGWLDEQRAPDHTIAVTHPAVIRSAMVHALQAPPLSFWRIDVAPLSLTDLRWNGRVWTVRSSGCALPGDAGQP
jgi:broad specificity phosphatase PhoE